MNSGVRWVRMHIGDAGYRVTKWFCCKPPPPECQCLRRVHVSYEGYFLKGWVYLVPFTGAYCREPLGLGGMAEPEFPHMEEIDCQTPCTQPPPDGPMPPPPPPVHHEGLQSLEFTQYWEPMSAVVNARFTGTEPAGSGAASFDTVTFNAIPHAVLQKATKFTLASQPVDPRPTMVNVSYSIDGAWKTGATVTAGQGRFLKTVKATVLESLTVEAEQDDGSKPVITYP